MNVPCGPINNVGQVFEDPQVIARGMPITMAHDADPALKLIGSPIKMSESPVSYRHPPPRLGEHTEEVLTELLALDAEAVAGLRRRGVV